MSRCLGLMLIAPILTLITGCACCRPDAGYVALCPAEQTECSFGSRNRVVVFLIGGADVLDFGGLSGLRDRLAEAGFANVYVGSFYHKNYFNEELDRRRCEDPCLRFVVIGREMGTASAQALASHGRKVGANIDAVFALDPIGPLDGQTAVFRSRAMTGGVVGAAAIVDVDASAFSLATDTYVVTSIAASLREIAALAPVDHTFQAVLPIIDDPAPTPRVLPSPKPELIQTPATLTGRTR
jgi:pimeloyl-ACP methyl ester carboxylesterase